MKMIVDGYVRLKDREALEDLRSHRRRLREQLQEQRVSEATRRLDDVKNRLAGLQKQSDSEEEETRMIEDTLPRTTDPKRQQELEGGVQDPELMQ